VAVPAPHPWCTEGEGLDEVARRALLAFVSAPQVLLDSGVGVSAWTRAFAPCSWADSVFVWAKTDARSIVELCQTAKSGKPERERGKRSSCWRCCYRYSGVARRCQAQSQAQSSRWRCTDSQGPMRLDRLATYWRTIYRLYDALGYAVDRPCQSVYSLLIKDCVLGHFPGAWGGGAMEAGEMASSF
jgi:hypothetical protein